MSNTQAAMIQVVCNEDGIVVRLTAKGIQVDRSEITGDYLEACKRAGWTVDNNGNVE